VGVRLRIGAALALAVVVAFAAGPARGEEGAVPNPPWPQALPPQEVPNTVHAHPVRRCKRATLRCVNRLARRLRRQWRRFDSACDHRAVISYSYWQITRGLRADLRLPQPGLVRHRRWMIYLITAFSNRYFKAFRNWAGGKPVPEGWRTTFEAAESGDVSAGQDVLLFSNVHVQHDLPLTMERLGLYTPRGASHKPDHDAVNEINARVFNPIEDYIGAHYDPLFPLIDLQPSPLDEIGTLELVKSWREQAWRSAERLLAARTPQERAEVVDQIRSSTNAWARFIASGEFPGYHQTRDDFCRAHR
jgi:uncharacterized protein DUF5995